jgi:protein SCO1/2
VRSPWLEPKTRGASGFTKVRVTDQDGHALDLSELNDRPLALTFLYTRCLNPNRCPLVADRMAELQKLTETVGLDGKVSLVVMTYDPDYDTPERLREYGRSHGVRFTPTVRLLQPDPAARDDFFDRLRVTVNYNAEGVNIHGLQLFLFDNKGRFVRRYQSLVWDNADVLADLKKLAEEAR